MLDIGTVDQAMVTNLAPLRIKLMLPPIACNMIKILSLHTFEASANWYETVYAL
jgi:hypothetical protein